MNIDLFATSVGVLTYFGILGIMALSLNIEYGVAGIPNFGKALFVSIGAYTAGITYTRLLPVLAGEGYIDPCGGTLGQALQLRSDIMQTMPFVGGVNFLLTLTVAALVGGVVGYLLSYMVLRLKQEWYLALVLLVGGEILRVVVRGYDPIICGTNGIAGIATPFASVGSVEARSLLFMAFVLLLLFSAFMLAEGLVRSPYGRMLRAVRENDAVARSLGKTVPRIRAQVMFIGSMMAAVAGVLFAVNNGFVSTNDYVVTLTLDVWVMIVLGGLGNNRGALLGAFLVTLLDRVTQIAAIQMNMAGARAEDAFVQAVAAFEFNYLRFILFGVILLLMLLYRPEGLLPENPRTTAAHDLLAESGD